MTNVTDLNVTTVETTKPLRREEIRQHLKKHLPMLNQQFKVERIGFFGSYARNQATIESDIDILVEFYEPIGWEIIDLQQYLEELLGHRVDLVTPNALKPQLKEAILNSVVYV